MFTITLQRNIFDVYDLVDFLVLSDSRKYFYYKYIPYSKQDRYSCMHLLLDPLHAASHALCITNCQEQAV